MGKIVKVSGPLVVATGMQDANMADVVRVGEQHLIGEILNMNGDSASIQVYEETSGIGPGAEVVTTGAPLSVELGPGLLENIYDGIQRPLEEIMKVSGATIARGIQVPALNREKKWDFVPTAKVGDTVTGGDIIGTVQETSSTVHKIMVPHGVTGTIADIQSGAHTVLETIAVIDTDKGEKKELTMMQKWPVRVGRPYVKKFPPKVPLCSGQRIIDTMFPIAKGGAAAVPGPFGSGKTVVQHQLAKWSDVDIVVYIGCGERGNEMTDVLREFPELVDPRTGESLMKRTILIANTSDMPVAAREASVYTGITIAEYFRDMGYDVAVIADSTSRSGGDLSEPVSQGTMRIVKVFWSLDASLASRRHFPAINWLNSYSLYLDSLRPWYDEHLGKQFFQNRDKAMAILQEESSLNEIVQLVGKDSLSPSDQLTLETARIIREDFLQQNAFADIDSYSDHGRQLQMLTIILDYDKLCRAAIAKGASLNDLFNIEARVDMGRAKNVPADQYEAAYTKLAADMEAQITAIAEKGEDD